MNSCLASPAPDVAVPEFIGHYRLQQCIGVGACGSVYKAYDINTNQSVAIKLSNHGLLQQNADREISSARRAYLSEVVAGRLKHPNIIEVYDAGVQGDLSYLVMELLQGEPLTSYCRGYPCLPVAKVASIIADCARALDYAHQQGILHRDIKPSNIMLTDAGKAKLFDFGIAVSCSPRVAARYTPSIGTPNYMSPEQILGVSLGPQSDLYSLATVMFELLTGWRPFKAEKMKDLLHNIVIGLPPKLERVAPWLPEGFSSTLEKALNKDPGQRFGGGEEFALELDLVAK